MFTPEKGCTMTRGVATVGKRSTVFLHQDLRTLSTATPGNSDRIHSIIPDADVTPSLGSQEGDAMKDSMVLFSTFYIPVIQIMRTEKCV